LDRAARFWTFIHLNRAYLNTIRPEEELSYPGDRVLERHITSTIRWNRWLWWFGRTTIDLASAVTSQHMHPWRHGRGARAVDAVAESLPVSDVRVPPSPPNRSVRECECDTAHGGHQTRARSTYLKRVRCSTSRHAQPYALSASPAFNLRSILCERASFRRPPAKRRDTTIGPRTYDPQ
jgi:hypothetical protein